MDDCHQEEYEIFDCSSEFGAIKPLRYKGWCIAWIRRRPLKTIYLEVNYYMKLPERSEKLNDGIYSTSESIIVYKEGDCWIEKSG